MPTPEEVAHIKKKEDLYSDSCFMWSLDHIYKYSLIIEPRNAKPPKTKAAKAKKYALPRLSPSPPMMTSPSFICRSSRSATAPPSVDASPVKVRLYLGSVASYPI